MTEARLQDTPARSISTIQPAPLYKRIFAGLADVVIYAAFMLVVLFVVGLAGGRLFPITLMSAYKKWDFVSYFSFAALFILLPVVVAAIWQYESPYRSSPGKFFFRLKVVNKDGSAASFRQMLLRSSMAAVYAIIIYLPGPLWAAIHDEVSRKDTAPVSLMLLRTGIIVVLLANVWGVITGSGINLQDSISSTRIIDADSKK